jgi:organic hydroperoxide reductase OsmC/OhrA
MGYEVEFRSLPGTPTAVGSAGPFTLICDRPTSAGGGGLGFNGGQLLNLAVGGCISNDLFREAGKRGVSLDRVVVRVDSDYTGDPATSTDIAYEVELYGPAPDQDLRDLAAHVDQIAEIPNSIRRGTVVRLSGVAVNPA